VTHSAERAGSPAAFRGARIAAALLLSALSFLPVGTWTGISFQRALSFRAVEWTGGVGLVLLCTALLLVMFWRDERADELQLQVAKLANGWDARGTSAVVTLSVIAFATYAIAARMIFDGKPLLIDELVQVIQARTFVSGKLWLPLDAHPEFHSMMHMVEQDGRLYGQFPPGGPAMLALGELVHAPWIVNPVFGAISVGAFAMALRWSGFRPAVSLGASLAFAFAPFVVFQSASHMNHVTSLTWLLIATAALVRATRSDGEHRAAGFVCGIALGMAATIRPLDAAAWALPAAVWLFVRALRLKQWHTFLLSGVGVAIPFGIMMFVNAQMTGSPLEFGYTVMWGASHGLGFHESPWGESHTVTRGIALTAAYLNRLNEYLFEVPAPSLVPAFASLALATRLSNLERYLLSSAGLVVAAYFAYWHDGFYLGPRFMYPLAPVATLLIARLPEIIRERWPGARRVSRGVVAMYVAAIVLAIPLVIPWRVRSYAEGFQSMRWDYDQLVRDAGAQGGTVLVRTSWGAQVIARLWGLGVSRSMTEVLYRRVDTCGLDDVAQQLEREGVRGAEAEARLIPMLADSLRTVPSPLSPDQTERMLPGSLYTPACMERIAEDRAGYAHFEPSALARDGGTRWMRDLHARDTLVVKDVQNVWVLRRDPESDTLPPRVVRANADSLRRAWFGTTAVAGGR
jgi:hypothetical protein